MTQRDWQKDMEMCEAATAAPWTKFENRIYGYCTTAVEPMVHEFNNENPRDCTNAEFISEARTALPYWLQEAKELQEIASGRGREYLKVHGLLKESVAREQRLKELLSDTMGCLVMSTSKDNEDIVRIAADYRTLYPDTPAPKEGSHEV